MTTVQLTSAPARGPRWEIEGLRAELEAPGHYLAYGSAADAPVAFPLRSDWTRIGRSLAADIRFDDPSVSRRHALIVRQPDGLRVLDDRSLNGVFVNGKRIEWTMLADGDEILIGCHRLYLLDIVGRPRAPLGRQPRARA